MDEDAQWREMDRLFDAALDLDPGDRQEFLADCEQVTRRQVEALLAEAEAEGDLLQPGGALERGFADELSVDLDENKESRSPRTGDRIGRWRVTAPVIGEISAELYEACDDSGREVVLEPLPADLVEAVSGWREVRGYLARMPTASELGDGEIIGAEAWQGREVLVWRRRGEKARPQGAQPMSAGRSARTVGRWIGILGWLLAGALAIILASSR